MELAGLFNLRHFLIFLTILFTLSLTASSWGDDEKETKEVYKGLQYEISKKSALLVSFKAEMTSLEKQLGQAQVESNERSQKMQSLENRLNELKLSLQFDEDRLRNLKRDNETLLGQYMMEVINQDLPPEVLAKKKIVAQILSHKISELTEYLKNIQGKKEEQESLSREFDEFKINKHNLDSLISDLSSQKNEISAKYQGEIEDLSRLNSRLDSVSFEIKESLKRKNKNTSSLNPLLKQDLHKMKTGTNELVASFLPPLHKFYKFKHGVKGVTFHYNQQTSIFSPDKGKVAYIGELASFGRVLMIEHDNDIRSVILGNFETKLKKDDIVSSQEEVGKTIVHPEKENSLYYEIRKNNIVQNTIQWLDKKLFSSKI